MQYVDPSRWPLPFLLAAGIGFGLGVFPLLHPLLTGSLITFVLVNLILPLFALVLGALYPRIRIAFLAGLLLGLSFWVGVMIRHEPLVWFWTPASLLSATHPILIIAIPAYAVIAAVSAAFAKLGRRVGLPDQDLRCKRCGYLQTGLPQPKCPECGRNNPLP